MQNLLKKPARAASRRKTVTQPFVEPVVKVAVKPAVPEPEKTKLFRSSRSLKHSKHLPSPEVIETDAPSSIHPYFTLPKRYLAHLPTLLLSLLGFALLIYLLLHFYPAQIANLFIPQLYLPITLVFFWSSFFGLSYLFLHTRRGAHWAVCLTILLWLKLQLVLTWPVALIVIGPLLITELILTLSHQ